MKMQKGFSLLELLIVLIVVGVMWAVTYNTMKPNAKQRETNQIIDEFFYIKNHVIDYYFDSTGYDKPVVLSTSYAIASNLLPPNSNTENGDCNLPSKHRCVIGLLRPATSPNYLETRDGFSVAIQKVEYSLCHSIIPKLAHHFKYVQHGPTVFKSHDQAYSELETMNGCDGLSADGGYGRILVSHY
jgi:prepilin-type N-terminal cleavage/methylation domain-containing protein